MPLSHVRTHAETHVNHPDRARVPRDRRVQRAELVLLKDNRRGAHDEELAGQLGDCGARTAAHGVRWLAARLAVAGLRGRWVRGKSGAHPGSLRLQRARGELCGSEPFL